MNDPDQYDTRRRRPRRRSEEGATGIVTKSFLRGFGWGLGRSLANLVTKGRP